MKCRKCGKNDAGFYISWGDGFGPKIGFCDTCAEEAGIFAALRRVESLIHGFGLEAGGLFRPEDLPVPVEFAEECQSCGTSLREFERRFLFGCEECGIVFGSLISNYLTLLGAGAEGRHGYYHGEPPRCFTERAKLQALQNKLKEKIEREDYKGAAKHRDTVNALEKKIGERREKSLRAARRKQRSVPAAPPESVSRLLLETRELPAAADNWLMSQIEVRRNFADFKFPSKADKAQYKQVENHALGFFDKRALENNIVLELGGMRPVERLAAGERFFRRRLNPSATALVSPDGGAVALINDTDHVAMCARSRERDPAAALGAVRRRLRGIEEEAELAFSPRFGYLTTAPKHIGAGLTASALLHLPYSFFRGRTLFWPDNAERASVRLDSFCGRNLEHHGFFRVSSPVGFGRPPEAIVSEVFAFAEILVAEQQQIREDLKPSEIKRIKNIMPRVLDHATRSYRLAYRDVLRLTTFIALGLEHGAVEMPSFSFDDVIPLMSSPFIMYRDGRVYSVNQCEKRRADLFAELIRKWSLPIKSAKKTRNPDG